MKPTKKTNYKGFTLVELIVVISILAILGTIAFLSFGGYSSKARDGSRISDTMSLSKGIELYQVQSGKYPQPENITGTGIIGTTTVALKGEIQDKVSNLAKISKTPKDPLSNNYYIYGTTYDFKQYQIATTLENTLSLNNNPTIQTTYADSPTYSARVLGNYKGLIKFNSGTTNPTTWITNIPSLIYNFSGSVSDMITDKDRVYFVVNKNNNLPYKIKDIIINNKSSDTLIKEIVNSSATLTGAQIISLTQTGITEQFTGTLLASFGGDISAITNIILGTATTSSNPPPTPTYTCSGTLVIANATITNNTNLTQDTPYQTTNSTNSCYYTCKSGFSGVNCEIKEVFGDEDPDSISACNLWVQNAVGTSAGGYANWLWVPARNFTTDGVGTPLTDDFYKRAITYNSTNYICKGFAVMKYEAKFLSDQRTQPDTIWKTKTCSDYTTDDDLFCANLSGDIGSTSNNYPIGDIRQGEAINACEGLSYNFKTSHLITNNEWMGIARNIEQQGINWTNGSVGNGGIYRGNVNLTDNMSYSYYQSTGNTAYLPTTGSDTDPRGTNANGNRRLLLSNNSNIWDISGNVREHVNKSNLPTTSNIRTTNSWNSNTIRLSDSCSGSTSWASFYNNDGVAACIYSNGYTYSNIGPVTSNLNSINGIGRILPSNVLNNIFIRGSSASNGVISGIYGLNLGWVAKDISIAVGFRCSL